MKETYTEIYPWGLETQEKSNFMISPFQAQFQIWMAKSMGARRILEIGNFIGFSTPCWSHAVGPTGHVTTLEFSPEYASIAEETFAKNEITNVEVLVGDARETLKALISTLSQPYDLILFIDADKPSYPTYLSLILSLSPSSSPSTSSTRLLKPNGLILADNILFRGLVVDSTPTNPLTQQERENGWREEYLVALREFNESMVENERIETFVMRLFDGLGCGRLVD